ncbi:MAG: Xaa-Pro peptidase family protein [Cyanobacteria bacterium REEB65]|nr:Xaa-Pro peptidase family protein [Cyanobacteria bacterium REEB65]
MIRNQFLRRLERLRESFEPAGQDGLLVSDLANIRYLTGFAGTFGRLVVNAHDCFLISDRRYLDVAAGFTEEPVFDLVCAKGTAFVERVADTIVHCGMKRLGFEPGALSWWEAIALESALGRRCTLVASGGQVEDLRRIKDALELEAIREAAQATERAIDEVLAGAKPATSENELAARLAAALRRHGEGPAAFEPLIASGERTAIIHARPTQRTLERGDLLLIDAGATVRGMAADLCRTVVIGQAPSSLQKHALGAVRACLDAAIACVGPGVRAAEIERVARAMLGNRGYLLVHDIGHGIGLEVHESPRLAEDSTDILEPGMVLAIEPGLYVAGWGGVRLEELVLVTTEGAERLTHFEHSLCK